MVGVLSGCPVYWGCDLDDIDCPGYCHAVWIYINGGGELASVFLPGTSGMHAEMQGQSRSAAGLSCCNMRLALQLNSNVDILLVNDVCSCQRPSV